MKHADAFAHKVPFYILYLLVVALEEVVGRVTRLMTMFSYVILFQLSKLPDAYYFEKKFQFSIKGTLINNSSLYYKDLCEFMMLQKRSASE